MRRDEDWFTRIYQTHYAQIVNYGRRRLASEEQALELAQDVFVLAWRRRTEVPGHSLPWLYGVARRLLANHWRAQRSAPQFSALSDLSATESPARADSGVALAEVREGLRRLSEMDQEILRLVGWEELSVSEAAQVLGCSAATAAVRLHRARRRLLQTMAAPSHSPATAVLPAHS